MTDDTNRNAWKSRDFRVGLMAIGGIWLVFVLLTAAVPFIHTAPKLAAIMILASLVATTILALIGLRAFLRFWRWSRSFAR
jgi:hypothetical protein